jgi:hypothetical protein
LSPHTNFGFWSYDFGLRKPYRYRVCSPGSGARENRNGISLPILKDLGGERIRNSDRFIMRFNNVVLYNVLYGYLSLERDRFYNQTDVADLSLKLLFP